MTDAQRVGDAPQTVAQLLHELYFEHQSGMTVEEEAAWLTARGVTVVRRT